MHATLPSVQRLPAPLHGAIYSVHVAGHDCTVRGYAVCPIKAVLGFEDEIDAAVGSIDDPTLVADVLESRMIAPLRPRRRRDRAVSSRAALYAPSR